MRYSNLELFVIKKLLNEMKDIAFQVPRVKRGSYLEFINDILDFVIFIRELMKENWCTVVFLELICNKCF